MRSSLFVLAFAAAGCFAAPVYSQDQENERRPDAPPGRGGMARAASLVAALDANQDNEISADEIAGAADALKTLDRDKNGKLTSDELQRRPGGRRGVADDGSRPQGFGQRRGPDGGFGGARGFGGDFRGGPPRADQDRGQPQRDAAERAAPDRGRRGPGSGGFGPLNPEQFVAQAMEFDANKDGELDKAELTAFAERMGGGIRGGFEGRGSFEGRGGFQGRGFGGRGGFGDGGAPPRNPQDRRGGDRPEPDRDQ